MKFTPTHSLASLPDSLDFNVNEAATSSIKRMVGGGGKGRVYGRGEREKEGWEKEGWKNGEKGKRGRDTRGVMEGSIFKRTERGWNGRDICKGGREARIEGGCKGERNHELSDRMFIYGNRRKAKVGKNGINTV